MHRRLAISTGLVALVAIHTSQRRPNSPRLSALQSLPINYLGAALTVLTNISHPRPAELTKERTQFQSTPSQPLERPSNRPNILSFTFIFSTDPPPNGTIARLPPVYRHDCIRIAAPLASSKVSRLTSTLKVAGSFRESSITARPGYQTRLPPVAPGRRRPGIRKVSIFTRLPASAAPSACLQQPTVIIRRRVDVPLSRRFY